MKTTLAARLRNYGGAEAIDVENASLLDPQSGQLLVRIHAAGVNPIDWKIRSGLLQQKMSLQFPATLGGDFSGVVEAIGPGDTSFCVGDEVYGRASLADGGSGSFAEFAIAPCGSTAAKPQTADHVQAAGLPLVGVSALQALTEHLCLSSGQSILIHGGAGGIGSCAIQLAKHLGARVATTSAGDGLDYTKRLGADIVIDYKAQNFEDVVRGADAVFDTVGGESYVRSFKVLKQGGRLVSMLEQPRRDLMTEFGVEASAQLTKVTTERLTRLKQLVDDGALTAHIDKVFTLAQASMALEYQEKQSPRGKVILKAA